MERSPKQIQAFWAKQVFTSGKIPPKEVSNDEEIIELVSKNPSAVGYIQTSLATDDVKQIALK